MAISYVPLVKTMEEKEISWYFLAQQGIDHRTLHQLRHNMNITLKTLEKICSILHCTPNDVLAFVPEKVESTVI
ncbi:MAG: helix-turn-helix transcriptional regulator [Eubacteriales bacterium]